MILFLLVLGATLMFCAGEGMGKYHPAGVAVLTLAGMFFLIAAIGKAATLG